MGRSHKQLNLGLTVPSPVCVECGALSARDGGESIAGGKSAWMDEEGRGVKSVVAISS